MQVQKKKGRGINPNKFFGALADTGKDRNSQNLRVPKLYLLFSQPQQSLVKYCLVRHTLQMNSNKQM